MRRRFYLLFAALALAAMVVAGCSESNTPGPKQDNVAQTTPQPSQDIPADEPVAQVASQVEPSVVQVNVSGVQTGQPGAQGEGEQSGLGSGVIYRRDGYIITNNHVVADASEVNIAFADGTTEQGEVVGTDPRTDLAVVRVDRDNLPVADFEEDGPPLVGQLAVAIGSPSGFESTVTAGVVSGLNREISPELTGTPQQASLTDLIQTDAAISPGNSGGALANRSGQIMGINAAYLPPQTGAEGIGFAIPTDTTISVADQLIETGQVNSPYIGIQPANLSRQDAQQFDLPVNSGVIVASVEQGTPADQAGLRAEDDIITAIDDTPIEDSGDLFGALRDYSPGDTVEITVVERNGDERMIDLTLGEAPVQQ